MMTILLNRLAARIRVPRLAATARISGRAGLEKKISAMWWKSSFALAMLMACHQAFAQGNASCTYTASSLTLTPGQNSLVVPSSLAVGEQIAYRSFRFSVSRRITCQNVPISNPVVRNITFTTPLSLAPGFTDVWETGYPGIGVRLILWNGQALTVQTSPALAQADAPNGGVNPNFRVYSALGPLNTSMQLVKTGPIRAGRFPGVLVGSDYATEAYMPSAIGNIPLFNSRSLLGAIAMGGLDIVVSNATCDLSAGDVNRSVKLEPFQLKDVPVTSGKFGVKNFTITANCRDARTASFTFSGTRSTVEDSLFANTGTAEGLGLHVGTPYGDVHANDTPEKRTFSVDASSGVAELPVEVGYSRSAAAVTTGTFLSKVTVTLSYN